MYFSICDVEVIEDTANITMGGFSFDLSVDDKLKAIADKKYDGSVKAAIDDIINDVEADISDEIAIALLSVVNKAIDKEHEMIK